MNQRPRSRFDRRREQWLRLSELLDRTDRVGMHDLSPDELADLGRLHRKVSSHLAQARAGVTDPEIVAYLNGLVARSHNTIYRPRSALSAVAFFEFLWVGFPRIVWKLWPYVLVSGLIFWGTAGLAYLVTWQDPTYAYLFVPAQFLSMIGPFERPDHTTGVLGPGVRGLLSGFIMQNNIKVGLLCFAGGALAGTVTVFHLLQNGAMVGGLVGAIHHYQNPTALLALLAPHGVIELWAVVLSGAAGLRLARGVVLPGRLTRRAALREAAREAVLLAVGTTLLFVVAAVIEGFVTPSGLTDNVKLWGVGGGSGVLLLLYLYWPYGRGGLSTRGAEPPA